MRLFYAAVLLAVLSLAPLTSANHTEGHDYGPTDLQCTGGPVFGFQPCGVAFYVRNMDEQEIAGAHLFYTQTEAHCTSRACTPPLPWCTDWGFVAGSTWRDYNFVCAIIFVG